MRVCFASLPILVLSLIAFLAAPCSADEDLLETFKNIDVFKLRSSAGACPLLVVGQVCPQENPLYYFKCCGDLNSSCCFRLQVSTVSIEGLGTGSAARASDLDRTQHHRELHPMFVLLLIDIHQMPVKSHPPGVVARFLALLYVCICRAFRERCLTNLEVF
ncbi:hypothetical protein ANCCAN_14302 [Ancylostoma caninum]|uniref:WAP domain-containing protein n=1 Tax=Ancylostoma caninum TaxID=29170 RepID=A0A368G9U2_ANCCA|nr:hypothetical protein ANCCAN_14302 [Ancylostoma caninum]